MLHATAVATDKEALIEMLDDIDKKNTSGQERLVYLERVFVVDYGTTVHLLSHYRVPHPLRVLGKEYTGDLFRARILDGEYAGEAVWVPAEWVAEFEP